MTRKRGPPSLLEPALESVEKQKSRKGDGTDDGSRNEQKTVICFPGYLN